MKTRSLTRTAKRAVLAGGFIAAFGLLPLLAAAAPLSSVRNHPYLPDPVAGRGADFPPSAATATTAYGGPPLAVPNNACTEYNPCALPSSAPRASPPVIEASR